MSKIIYPLDQVLSVKKRRVQEAEKVVREKEEMLKKEEEILVQKEKERDKVRDHFIAKMDQLRATMDEGTTSPKIQQMKHYIDTVDEKLQQEEKKVTEQKEQVATAEKNLEVARSDLKMRRLEVDKLETHKKDWVKEMRKEMQIIEERDLDEIGSTIYSTNQRKK